MVRVMTDDARLVYGRYRRLDPAKPEFVPTALDRTVNFSAVRHWFENWQPNLDRRQSAVIDIISSSL